MNYERELQRLEHLRRTDLEAYLDDLDQPWSGMADDLDLAVRILLTHAARSGGRLALLEACDLPENSEAATVTLPEWWLEIITTFAELYEPAEAKYRAQKVLNELIGKAMGRDGPAASH